jgi:hypothetical protein
MCSALISLLNPDRRIGASREQARQDRENEERENVYSGTADDDDDML